MQKVDLGCTMPQSYSKVNAEELKLNRDKTEFILIIPNIFLLFSNQYSWQLGFNWSHTSGTLICCLTDASLSLTMCLKSIQDTFTVSVTFQTSKLQSSWGVLQLVSSSRSTKTSCLHHLLTLSQFKTPPAGFLSFFQVSRYHPQIKKEDFIDFLLNTN